MKFFFDRCIPAHIARMLAAFDQTHNVVHQDDDKRFEANDTDARIIETLSKESPKPVFVTADLSQKRVPAERAALGESGMTVFFLKKWPGNPHAQALKLLAIWPTLTSFAENARAPTIFQVPFGPIGNLKLNDKVISLGKASDYFKDA